ncbi:sugar-binding protein [Bacillus sp. FJAT-27251]|uniref:sugar-binding protein n=1 Tax=Bacillus sp. FJAT-27251 TaxID=1684142 RepID=UPI0006A7EFEE|nr:sugar-binding protein [Bacillus sp. FJAT-27251]
MKRVSIFYSLLIAFLIGASLLSFYYYGQSNRLQKAIEEASFSPGILPDYHFVLIGEEMDNDYWRLVGEGAKAAEDKYNVMVEYKGPRRSNLDEQLKLMDMAIAARVDGIIVQALNEEKFIPMINKAVKQGIPVITIDTDASASTRSLYIGTDNYEAGKLAGQTLIQDTGGQARVAIITGSFTSAHHQLRVEGFLEAVEDAPDIEVIAIEESNITRIGAEEKAYWLLEENDHITAFFGASALDGIGISSAVSSSDKKDDMYIIAFDALPETVDLMQEGMIDAIVAQEPFEMGFQSVERMFEVLEGKSHKDVYHTDASVIRRGQHRQLDRDGGGHDD